jgi:hypothetical protein
MFRLAAVILLLLTLPVRANLGENVAELTKRYGKFYNFTEANAKTPFGTIAFIAGPYEMIVFLYRGVEVGARVSKRDKSAFNPDEIKTILNADGTPPWTSAPSDDPASPQWTRADKATANYDAAKQMLIFTTPQMKEALDAGPPVPTAPSAPTSTEPPRPPGDFAPAAPTQWAPPVAPSTNAPATNAPPK